MLDLLLMEWVTKMKPGSNSVEDHPQLSQNGHPVDGALVGARSWWPRFTTLQHQLQNMMVDFFGKEYRLLGVENLLPSLITYYYCDIEAAFST